MTALPWSESHQRRQRVLRPAWPVVLRRTRPVSDVWGFDRGTPVDRHYIDSFLDTHRRDIRGRVLEVKDSAYTERYGREVVDRQVLDIDATNPSATIVADLSDATQLPTAAFDCFILTQTLHLIYDLQGAVRSCGQLLRPGGVLLVTGPAVSRVRKDDCWRFTPHSLGRLLEGTFARVSVSSYGNVLAAKAFLDGMAQEEVPRRLLDKRDERYPVIVAARAVKG
jgi:SAM-dependent methyltransferase